MIQPLPLIVIVIITMIVVQPVIGYCRASSIWAANASSTTITTTTNNHDLHHNHGYIRGGCNDYATLKDSSAMLQDDNIEDAPAQEVKDNNRNNPEEYSIVGEESASSTTPKKSTRKALTVTSNTVVYTTDADFDIGSTINVNHDDVHDQLQLDSKAQPFDFIWVACSGRGTVVKVNTLTGAILGEYKSAPRADGSPSRTTVDKDGSVWLSNRNDIGPNGNGTIVHIGLLENNQCEDRNGDKIIQTSTGLGDIKVWANESGTRGVQTAEDECIVHYTEVSSTGTRHLSIDADNNVWVSGSSNQAFDKVKGGRYDIVDANGKHSGDILTSYPSVGYGGYGGLMDPNGFIWSARPLLRWDTSKPLIGANGDPAGDSIGPLPDGINWAGQSSPDSYGLCIDRQGNIWNTELGSGINKYAPDGTHIARYTHGFGQAQGCVVDKNDDVWVAHSINGGSTVGHLKNNGTYLGSIEVGSGPSGVAVDRAGKVWSTNKYDDTISRIDPSLNGGIGVVDLVPPVKLGDGCQPYNYGDMTGSTIAAPPNTGSWTVKYDHGSVLAAWGSIQWTSATPGDSSLTVQVRNNDVDPWKTVTNGQNLSSLTGQYLHVQVNFSRATSTSSSIGASPVLIDLSLILPTISTPSPTTPVSSTAKLSFDVILLTTNSLMH
jgi:streptogramin lyase